MILTMKIWLELNLKLKMTKMKSHHIGKRREGMPKKVGPACLNSNWNSWTNFNWNIFFFSLFSNSALIIMSILRSPYKMLTLSGIYEYILNYFPYYQTDNSPWRNDIRHELSIQKKVFKKLPEKDSKGHHFWMLQPSVDETFINQKLNKSKKSKTMYKCNPCGLDFFNLFR